MIWWTLRQLRSADPLKRIRAASTLGATGDPAHVGVLIRTLSDPQTEVRVAAIEALAKIGDRRAIGPLAQAMRDPCRRLVYRASASRALLRFGEAAAVGPLADGLRDPSADFRGYCATTLAGFKDTGVLCRILDQLIAATEDPSRSVRGDVAVALRETKHPRALQPLIALLRDSHRIVQMTIAHQLGCLGNPGAIEPLLDMFEKTPRRVVRESILWSLGVLGHPTDALRKRIGIFDPIALVLSWLAAPPDANESTADLNTLISQFQREGSAASDRLAEILRALLHARSERIIEPLMVARHVQLTPKLEAALTEVASSFAPEIPEGGKTSFVDLQSHKHVVALAKAALKR